MNYPSIKLGSAVIADEDYFRSVLTKIKNTREWFTSQIKEMGYTVLPSSANFVFASPAGISAKEVFEAAKENGIYFRYFNSPGIDNYLRITIGTDAEMERVVEFLKTL